MHSLGPGQIIWHNLSTRKWISDLVHGMLGASTARFIENGSSGVREVYVSGCTGGQMGQGRH
jgi:hypothetical protein